MDIKLIFKLIVGYVFVLLCPFIGGLAVPVAAIQLGYFDHSQLPSVFGIYSVIWVLLWALWFDDSSYQRSL